MNPEEYAKLYAIERDHWFYKGKRAIVLHWLKKLTSLDSNKLLLDVGAGTGICVEEFQPYCRTLGIESSPIAIGLAYHSIQSQPRLLGGSITAIPLKNESVDIVLCLDVLEHIADDRQAFLEIVRVIRPGGLVIITVPAFNWAASDWDVALGHHRRYNLTKLQKLIMGPKISIVYRNYINSFVFWPVVVYRKLRTWYKNSFPHRMEDQVPPTWLNRLLYFLFVWPATKPWPMPLGLSCFMILRRKSL